MYGDPRLPKHFWSRVSVDDAGCWIWSGTLSKGYGRVSLDGIGSATHRLTYEKLVGPIPVGLQIDHLCRVPACCNPTHLDPVTAAENIRRGETSKWQRDKTHCPQGHEYDEVNTYRYARKDGTKERQCIKCIRIRTKERNTVAVVIGIGRLA